MVALSCLLAHAWIGLWQVLSDYVKCTLLRGVGQATLVFSFADLLF